MDHVVPGPLRRLREADIIDMAGLKSAALGQEYYRIGAVHTTMYQGLQITGIVDIPTRTDNDAPGARSPGIAEIADIIPEKAASPANSIEQAPWAQAVKTTRDVDAQPGRYPVTIEIRDSSTLHATCTCQTDSFPICPHAAALLYQWLAHPTTFVSPRSASSYATSIPPSYLQAETESPIDGHKEPTRDMNLPPSSPVQPAAVPVEQVTMAQGATPPINELLAQLSLSELRPLAREYDITRTGLNKQQLIGAMIEALKQPELIRKVVGTLEKPQRQLLAALTLAGGMVTNEELRGLYERFSLGYPNQLQGMLSTLRSKCLLLRVEPGFLEGYSSMAGTSLEESRFIAGILPGRQICWYVPSEIRAALHVTVPITPFDVQATKDGHAEAPSIHQARPYRLLEDLLLVARALDGHHEVKSGERSFPQQSTAVEPAKRLSIASHGSGASSNRRITSPLAIPANGIMPVPPPHDMPSPALLESLQAVIPHVAFLSEARGTATQSGERSDNPPEGDESTLGFLRFAIRLLRLVDILFRDDNGTPYLRILPNAARLLLGPTCTEVAHDLFVRWLAQPTYAELFELQEEGLRLRCRMASMGRPALRSGELEMENTEARQMLIALLAKVPLNQWINFAAFARFVYRLNSTFLQKQHNLYSSPPWWLEQDEGRTLRPTQLNDWLQAEGRYIARLLCGPLHWWGICDVALSKSGQLLAFRLTPLGGVFVHGKQQSTSSSPLSLAARSASGAFAPDHRESSAGDVRGTSSSGDGQRWHGSSESRKEVVGWRNQREHSDRISPLLLSEAGDILISSSSTTWPLIELLEDFAEVAGVQDGRLRYRLTVTSLGEALSHSLQPATLLQLLHQHAEPSSAPLLAQFERRIKNYGHVRLYTDVTLLEVADKLVIRELSAITPLEEQVVRSIHPTLLILKKQGAERIVQDLKRRGQVPLLHDEEEYGAE